LKSRQDNRINRMKNCGNCKHVSVCIVYLNLWEIVTGSGSPIKSIKSVLNAVAENCEEYEGKEPDGPKVPVPPPPAGGAAESD
jgi:hypothetical protein